MPLANLTLRFGADKVRATVRWPAGDGRGLALLVTDEMGLAGPLLEDSVVVALRDEHDDAVAASALRWLGDHAGELGAAPDQLTVGGGARAVALAVAARDNGWPPLRRQLVVYPRFTAAHPAPALATGLAPATIVRGRPGGDDGRRYASLLRAAGVAVRELAR